jgi:hypothetical protein
MRYRRCRVQVARNTSLLLTELLSPDLDSRVVEEWTVLP